MNAEKADRREKVKAFLDRYGLGKLSAADLDLALTHRSYAYECELDYDNERLEFLGDSIISTVTSEFLYRTDRGADEGTLSKRRSRLINRTVLGRRAIQMGMGEIILLGRGERETGGARRRSTLGSALEALVGVVYLRLGYHAAHEFVSRHVLEEMINHSDAYMGPGDFKSQLQEWAQREYKTVPQYRLIREEGPAHEKRFTVRVMIGEREMAQGEGSRIKIAENDAARQVLEQLQEPVDHPSAK